MKENSSYQAVVIGASAGGLGALSKILGDLPVDYPVPVIIVQHRSKDERNLLEEVLQSKCLIHIRQAEEKEQVLGGAVYFAPPGYHLLIEADRSFSLTCDEPVNYSRPSIDLLFESAADVYDKHLVGIILTGANGDGAGGLKMIRKMGGLTIVQDPGEADFNLMPQAALSAGAVHQVMTLAAIKDFLMHLPKK